WQRIFPVGSKIAKNKRVTTPSAKDRIEIRGARQNNLKGIDVDLPLGKLTVVTGPSGSGKSSLAFETIYAEGQRRYVETFSPYMRQFLDRMDKPRVDDIRGIPPAIAIEQANPVKSSRSTVGTMTEINDYLKLLWPRVARAFCPSCGREIRPETARSIADQVLRDCGGGNILVTFWVSVPAKTEPRAFFEFLQQQGYLRIWIDNAIVRVDVDPKIKRLGARVQVIQDRIAINPQNRTRLVEAIETALRFAKGKINGVPISETGKTKPESKEEKELLRACAPEELGINIPFEELPKADQDFVINGEKRSGDYTDDDYENDRWYGVRGFFRWLESKTYKMHVRVLLSRYRAYTTCPSCNGGRFQLEALNYKMSAKSAMLALPQLAALSISQARDFLGNIDISPNDSTAKMLRSEICARLNYLSEVGVGYLTLDRSTRTLSGGEVQRVNLTTCLGASLVNALFVMDEPSVGLHPRDIGRLVGVMHNLRDKGNTLLVVEHEERI